MSYTIEGFSKTETDSSRKIEVRTEPKTQFTLKPIVSDPSAGDLTKRVSTEQQFSITTKINHIGADFFRNDSFVVELREVPKDFVYLDDSEKRYKVVKATDVLADYEDYADELSGDEVEVVGTSGSDITVQAPTVAAASDDDAEDDTDMA